MDGMDGWMDGRRGLDGVNLRQEKIPSTYVGPQQMMRQTDEQASKIDGWHGSREEGKPGSEVWGAAQLFKKKHYGGPRPILIVLGCSGQNVRGARQLIII